MRKKRRVPAPPKGSRPGTGRTNASLGDEAGPMDDNASLSSAYTARTGTTFRTKASQPDFTRLPVEYDKVGDGTTPSRTHHMVDSLLQHCGADPTTCRRLLSWSSTHVA